MNFRISTKGHNDIIDITEKVEQAVKQAGVKNGQVLVFVAHQTCAITTLEYEPGLIQDLKELIAKIVPANKDYQHNQAWGDGNGAAHLLAALFKPDLTLPIANGQLIRGTWQQIILIDFDNRPRDREIIIDILENKKEKEAVH